MKAEDVRREITRIVAREGRVTSVCIELYVRHRLSAFGFSAAVKRGKLMHRQNVENKHEFLISMRKREGECR